MRSNTLFSLYPLVPVVTSLILGLVTSHLLLPSVGPAVWIVFLCLSVLAGFLSATRPFFQSWSLLFSVFFFGAALMRLTDEKSVVPLTGIEEDLEAVVASEPIGRGRVVRFDALVTSGRLCGEKVRVAVLKDTATHRYRALVTGCGIRFRSRLEYPEKFTSDNAAGSGFDYAEYLKIHGIVATAFVRHGDWRSADVSLLGLPLAKRVALAGLYYRHRLIERYRHSGLAGQVLAVTAAMTLGHKAELSADIKDAYSLSGVSHTLALSGMHLGIIYFIISLMTLRRRPSLLRELFILVSVWGYVFLVGMPLSVVRAAVMITVYSFVGLGGRDRMSLNVLAFTAIVMLIVNPLSLYDAGFQLSFISVASILILYPPLSSLLDGRFRTSGPLLRRLWQIPSVSFCAQLGTAPLIAYYFGRLPVYSLLANVVAVPVVAVILYLAVAMLALSFIPFVRGVAAAALTVIVSGLNAFLIRISSLPFSSIDGITLTSGQVVCVYAFMASVCFILHILFTRADRWHYNTWR